MYRLIALPLFACCLAALSAQVIPGNGETATSHAAQLVVAHALENELNAAEDLTHPMRYWLRKTTPRLTTTKEILETNNGDVAKLIAAGDRPLSPDAQTQEEMRLMSLLGDPDEQNRRKRSEDEDAARALKVLRVLWSAFLYEDAGPGQGPTGKIEKFTFQPNPAFIPADIETQVLPAMSGEIWIDPVHLRVARIEAHVNQDVNFGWGILGRLNKGGWIVIEQADVGGGQWHTVRVQLQMSGRVVFKNRVFDTTEEESHFAPIPAGLTYQQAIAMLLDEK